MNAPLAPEVARQLLPALWTDAPEETKPHAPRLLVRLVAARVQPEAVPSLPRPLEQPESRTAECRSSRAPSARVPAPRLFPA